MCFASAGAVFGAKPIAVMSAGCLAEENIIAKPKGDIGRPKKVEKPIVKPKIAVDMA